MKTSFNRFLTRTAAAIAFAMIVAPVFAAPPSGGDSKVVRMDNNTGAIGEASYNLEAKSKYDAKYESKAIGLGEDGADQTDLFVIDVSKISNIGAVRVKTKADTTVAYSTLSNAGDSNLDSQGFLVAVESLTKDQLVISIRSDSNVSALSHVSFSINNAMYD